MAIKVKKGIVEYISAMGMKVVFKSDIRFDRNGLHHTGWDVKRTTEFGAFTRAESC